MRKIFTIVMVLLALALSASAATLSGEVVILSVQALINGSNLSDSTTYTPESIIVPAVFTGTSVGDYSVITPFSFALGGVIDEADLSNYTLDFGAYGTFVATSGVRVPAAPRLTDFAQFFFLGNFNPGPGLAGFDVSPTSVRISLNQSGNLVSYTGTLATPPDDGQVPEPSTYAMMGAGVGLLAITRIRKNRS